MIAPYLMPEQSTGGTMNPIRNPRILFGSLLIVLGLVFIMRNVGLIEHVPLARFWPVILMLIGIGRLLQAENGKERWDGVWLLVLGMWFQCVTLHVFDMTYRNSWPLLLILGGIHMSGKALMRRPHMTLAEENGNGH
jgi:hypothetical protein